MNKILTDARAGLKPVIGTTPCPCCEATAVPLKVDKKGNVYAWCGHQETSPVCGTKIIFGKTYSENLINDAETKPVNNTTAGLVDQQEQEKVKNNECKENHTDNHTDTIKQPADTDGNTAGASDNTDTDGNSKPKRSILY